MIHHDAASTALLGHHCYFMLEVTRRGRRVAIVGLALALAGHTICTSVAPFIQLLYYSGVVLVTEGAQTRGHMTQPYPTHPQHRVSFLLALAVIRPSGSQAAGFRVASSSAVNILPLSSVTSDNSCGPALFRAPAENSARRFKGEPAPVFIIPPPTRADSRDSQTRSPDETANPGPQHNGQDPRPTRRRQWALACLAVRPLARVHRHALQRPGRPGAVLRDRPVR